MSSEYVTLYVTCANREEAREIAHRLLAEKRIACANLLEGVTSLYRWQGELQEEHEVLLLAKTLGSRVQAAITEIRKLHSYANPCITVLPIVAGDPDYLQWVKKEVS